MADSVRAAVLVGPGRYELQEFPYPRPPDGALLLQVEMVGTTVPDAPGRGEIDVSGVSARSKPAGVNLERREGAQPARGLIRAAG